MIATSAPIVTGIRHIVTHHERTTAFATGWVSWNAGMAVETATGDTGLGVWTQLGVAGLVIVGILFMLRRSDRREAAKDRIITEIEDARIDDLKAQIATLEAQLKRKPTARTRATDQGATE